jgi:hypothetical protein
MSPESQKPNLEIPKELQEYKELSENMWGDGPELHLLKLQELADSLYSKDEEFKKIRDGQTGAITDREKAQALMFALSLYGKRFELTTD